MGTTSEIIDLQVFEDREHAGAWRVEYFDGDGGCYVTIFTGPKAGERAQVYFQALKNKILAAVTAD